MDILKNINERLTIVEKENIKSGEQGILQLTETSPIKLPDDYISFLKSISGNGCMGIWFEVDGSQLSIWIWSALEALGKYADFQEFIDNAWLIGNDLGDTVFLYGEGKEGFGIYKSDAGAIWDYEEKIADTLTDFLVNGKGIDAAVSII